MAKLKDEEVINIVQSYWGDIGQFSSELSRERTLGIKYYNRDFFGGEKDGWSNFVSSDVFDAVEWTLAECMDIYFSTSPVGSFVAESMNDIQAAEQETKMVKTIIEEQNDGFLLFYTWLKDALIQKNGIVKVYWDDVVNTERETYKMQSFPAFQSLMADKDVEVKAVTAFIGEQELSIGDIEGMPPEMVMMARFDVDCLRKSDVSRVRIENVQPENFFVDKTHSSLNLNEAMFVAERVFARRSDLIAAGYSLEKIERVPKTTILFNSEEERARDSDRLASFQSAGSGDKNTFTDRVEIMEVYFRADVKNKGDMRLYRAVVGGAFGAGQAGNGVTVVLECEEADSIPYCALSPNIVPHRFWGISKYDEIGDIQRFKSTLLRGTLDNMTQHNAPVTVVPDTTGIDTKMLADADPGGVIPAVSTDGIMPLNVEYVADKNIPILGLLDELAERRTGISKVTQGLDPAALSESTQFVGASILNASQKKLKNIVRIFAETGIKSLYLKTHELLRKYAKDAMILRDAGKYYEVDPREWRKRKSFDITVGTGRTDKEAKVVALQGVLALQQNIAAQGLMNNPLLTPQHLYRTMSELVTLSGLGDVEKYFANPDEFQPEPPPPAPMDKAMDIEEARVTADAAYKAESLQIEKVKTQISIQKLEIEKAKLLMEQGQKLESEKEIQELPQINPRDDLELESMRLENAMKNQKFRLAEIELKRMESKKEKEDEDENENENENEEMIKMLEDVKKVTETNSQMVTDAINKMTVAMQSVIDNANKNVEKAMETISRPTTVVRENGRIVRLEKTKG